MMNNRSFFNESQRSRRRVMVVFSVLLVAFFAAWIRYWTQSLAKPDRPNSSQYTPSKQSGNPEEELADSFQAVQNAVVRKMGSWNISDVEWLEHRHEGHLGSYYHEGDVKVIDQREQEHFVYYEVDVQLRPDDKWEVSSISVEKVR